MPLVTMNVPTALYNRIVADMERRAENDPEEGGGSANVAEHAMFRIDYSFRREDALNKHKLKKAIVKEALKAGMSAAAIVEKYGVEFKRYVPTFKQEALDAAKTDRNVKQWTREAPVKFDGTRIPAKAKGPIIRKNGSKRPQVIAEHIPDGNPAVAAAV